MLPELLRKGSCIRLNSWPRRPSQCISSTSRKKMGSVSGANRMRNLFCLSPSNQTLLWQQIGRNMFPSSARTALKASILFNERERPPCAASPPPEGDHEKNGDTAEDIFPFFRRGSPFQPLLSSLTLDAYSGSETDPSEAFSGRRPRREDTGPSGSVPGSRPPSILNHGFFGVPWSKRCNMGAFR